jgi:hypothetical protein
MRDYQKEYNEYPVKCIKCGQAWVPNARHVDGQDETVEDCKPDNLTYLEFMYEQSLKQPKGK